jgi:hypothetical protein
MNRVEKMSKAKSDGPVVRDSETFLSAPGPNRGTRRMWECITETMQPGSGVEVK